MQYIWLLPTVNLAVIQLLQLLHRGELLCSDSWDVRCDVRVNSESRAQPKEVQPSLWM